MYQTTILLVEDEPLIALDLKSELEARGYLPLMAADVQDALRLAARHLPDIAILNFHTGHMPDGMALACLLRTRYLMKVLFITGARPQELEASADFYAGQEVLYKPFTRRQLTQFLFPEPFPPFPENRSAFTE